MSMQAHMCVNSLLCCMHTYNPFLRKRMGTGNGAFLSLLAVDGCTHMWMHTLHMCLPLYMSIRSQQHHVSSAGDSRILSRRISNNVKAELWDNWIIVATSGCGPAILLPVKWTHPLQSREQAWPWVCNSPLPLTAIMETMVYSTSNCWMKLYVLYWNSFIF